MQKIFAPCPEFSYSYPTDFFYTRSVALNFSSTCSADASDSSVAFVKKENHLLFYKYGTIGIYLGAFYLLHSFFEGIAIFRDIGTF